MKIFEKIVVFVIVASGLAYSGAAISVNGYGEDDHSFIEISDHDVVSRDYGPVTARPRDRDMIKPPFIPRIPPK